MRGFAGGPALDQIAVCITDFQLCTGQFLAVSDVLLGNVYTGAQVGVRAVHDLPRDLLTLVGEGNFHRGAVQQVTRRGCNFHNAVSAAVLVAGASRTCRVNVIFAANRHVHIKPSKAAGVGCATGGQLCTGVQQLCTVCGINVIHGVEFIHRTGQIGQRLSVLLVNAYTDFADFIAGLFGNRQHTGIFKHKCLPGLVGIRGILDVHDAVRTFLVAVLFMADNSFCQHNVIFLVFPTKFHSVALLGQHKTIRRLNLGNGVLTQRQGHGNFAFGAIMGNFQEIIGCLRAGGAEFHLIHLPLCAGGNSCHQIVGFVPVGALAVWCGNVGCSVNFVHRACKVVLRVDELSILVVGQHIAQLTNGKLTECFVIAVFLRDDVLVHVVGSIAHDLPDAVRLDFKLHRVGRIVEIAFRALQFFNQVSAKRQFFGCFHKAVCIGVEHIGFLGGAAAGRVDHGNTGLAVFFVQSIQRKGCVANFDRLAGFGVGLDELQIAFQFLVQHVKGHIIVAGGGNTASRNRESALRAVGVHCHDERITLEHILGDGGFYYQILPIRQALHAENALIVREHFSQPIFSGLIRGHPAVTLAVGVVAVCGQGCVIGVDCFGTALVHIGDGLSLMGEIVL